METRLKRGNYRPSVETLKKDIDATLFWGSRDGFKHLVLFSEQFRLSQDTARVADHPNSAPTGFDWTPTALFEKAISKDEASALWLFTHYPSLREPKRVIDFMEAAIINRKPRVLEQLIHALKKAHEELSVTSKYEFQELHESLKKTLQGAVDLAVSYLAMGHNSHRDYPCLRILLFGEYRDLVSKGITKAWLDSLLLRLKGSHRPDDFQGFPRSVVSR
jgi:hypothetical protein